MDIYNEFDNILGAREKRNIKRKFDLCLESIRNYIPFPIAEAITRRHSSTFRDGFRLLNTQTINIL
jgi:hypothetical protein